MFVSDSHQIRYSQSWEDADLLLNALALHPDDNVFSITSGGCNTLAMASLNVHSILAADINPAQNFLLELKLRAIQHFGYDLLLEFLGVRDSNKREELYHEISDTLTDGAKHFWDEQQNAVRKGCIHSGKFEGYLQLFRKYFLPFIHSKKTTINLITPKALLEQKEFYSKKWDSYKWRLLFRIFFSKPVMQALGRSPEMFRFAAKDAIGEYYLSKTQKAFTDESLFDNSYVEYILRGNYFNSLPFYIRPETIQRLKSKTIKMDLRTGHIIDILGNLPDNSLSKYNLSDVFESLSEEGTQKIFSEILRTGCNNARIVFWNNLVKRDVSKRLAPFFRREKDIEMQLRSKEKVFFYEDLKIYTLRK